MKLTYTHTLHAAYCGCLNQAIINNLTPLFFVIFQRSFGFSLTQISLLISLNFLTQIAVDLLSARFVDKIGYRAAAQIAFVFSILGTVCLGTLPNLLPSPYIGVCVAVMLMAIGSGLIEVMLSPLVDALPLGNKAAGMSMLHSFFCWGQVGTVALSTVYFSTIGTAYWQYLPILWAIVPIINLCLFSVVPITTLQEQRGENMPLRELFRQPVFWLMMVLMMCAGASEIAMSQWSSLFAEEGLGVSKTVGDLLGPCAFAVLMGCSRLFYGLRGHKIDVRLGLLISAGGCVAAYLLTVFAPHPILSLCGCALTGLSVGLMWPGVFSFASQRFPNGGTPMFAIFAFAGDLGCVTGPAVVGLVSDHVITTAGGEDAVSTGLKVGMLVAALFPLIMFLVLCGFHQRQRQKDKTI